MIQLNRTIFALAIVLPAGVVAMSGLAIGDDAATGPTQPFFDGKTLDGWEAHGGFATYKVDNGIIVGTTAEGSPNTFLCKGPYSDFVLEFDVLCDKELNSGVQIRSHVRLEPKHPKGVVFGYQCEIAPGDLKNCGNFWDEARRDKWWDDFSNKPDAQHAFRPEGWNHYRIVAQADHIRSWVNDVPCADFRDSTDSSGLIGLQVHGVRKGSGPFQVRWKNLRLQELKPGETVK